MTPLPCNDLDAILEDLDADWQLLREADVLVTGGTGFFGVWLVSALVHANRARKLGLRVHVLARKPAELLVRVPGLSGAAELNLLEGDIRSFVPPSRLQFTHVIHAATSASAALNEGNPLEMAYIAAEGTRRVLALADEQRVRRVLFTSSGAVYGTTPNVTHVREDQMGTIDPLLVRNAYAEGKRLAEFYCSAYHHQKQLGVVIARCFAFVGPYLPLDAHFAVGNFMRDALAGTPIVVKSDGTPRRSYLYATDMVSWLLQLLVRGEPGRAYNVGSDQDISVGDLAKLVGELRSVPFEILGKRDPSKPVESYVPSTERIRAELGASQLVDLREAVRRTMDWYGQGRAV